MRLALAVVLAACGSAPADAAFDADGCPVGNYVALLAIADGDSAFTPSQIQVPEMQYARFITSETHDMHFTAATDSAGAPPAPIGFAMRTCLQFGRADTPFHLIVTCSVHGETAEIFVEPLI